MHPLSGHGRRLGWYLLAWVPLGGLLAYLLAASAGLRFGAAVALAAPLALVYAFACLPIWYTCRVLPLGRVLPSVLGAQIAAAVTAGGLWTGLAKLLTLSYGWRAPMRGALAVVWGTGILLYLLAAAGFYLELGLARMGAAERRALAARALAREAELRALKAQINPHFLFNSLNSISALTAANAERAREMCVLLGDFLRRTLALGGSGERAAVSLAEELALVRAFLAIEQARFGTRLRLQEQIEPAALAARLPPLLLQPLVENAVVHGIANLIEGGCIRLAARCANGAVQIEIRNPFDPEAPRRGDGGVGLNNVRERLRARFDARARFEARATEDEFCVTLAVPLETEER